MKYLFVVLVLLLTACGEVTATVPPVAIPTETPTIKPIATTKPTPTARPTPTTKPTATALPSAAPRPETLACFNSLAYSQYKFDKFYNGKQGCVEGGITNVYLSAGRNSSGTVTISFAKKGFAYDSIEAVIPKEAVEKFKMPDLYALKDKQARIKGVLNLTDKGKLVIDVTEPDQVEAIG